jgi:hypothetical protein
MCKIYYEIFPQVVSQIETALSTRLDQFYVMSVLHNGTVETLTEKFFKTSSW